MKKMKGVLILTNKTFTSSLPDDLLESVDDYADSKELSRKAALSAIVSVGLFELSVQSLVDTIVRNLPKNYSTEDVKATFYDLKHEISCKYTNSSPSYLGMVNGLLSNMETMVLTHEIPISILASVGYVPLSGIKSMFESKK